MSQAGSILPEVVAQVVDLLRADSSLAGLLTDSDGAVKVWALPPIGIIPPYLWVVSNGEESLPTKLGAGHYGRTCTVKVIPVSRQRGTLELDTLGSLVMQALERQPLTLTGFDQAGIVWDVTHGPIFGEAEGGPQVLRELIFRASAR
jgi:hypothetical protein